jgi:ribosomal protein S18 acetylase RimI-like enzyme
MLVIHYRTFRNPDPPALVDVWNRCTSRGGVALRMATLLEYFTLAKPYFDPQGLIVAEAEGRVVGFAHAGFGPSADEKGLDQGVGILCVLAVRPEFRRQGIGSELLRRAEDYLRSRGARELLAGPLTPRNPFTFGLYGGSDSPGILDSDTLARPFLERRGYSAEQDCLVFQRGLGHVAFPPDPRFAAHRMNYEILAQPCTHPTWWRECVLGPVDLIEYRLQERTTARLAARLTLWVMETFSQQWNENAVGIVALEVPPELRRQGLGKFLLAQILRHLQEQFFTLVETHAAADNPAAIGLLRGLEFRQVDAGHTYRRGERG